MYHPCREQYGSESAQEDVLLGKNQLGRELALAADRMQFFKKVSIDCARARGCRHRVCTPNDICAARAQYVPQESLVPKTTTEHMFMNALQLIKARQTEMGVTDIMNRPQTN